MRSSFAALAIAGLALGPFQPASAGGVRVHICGSDRTIPLPLPVRRSSDGGAPCHGSAALPESKKRLRILC